MRNTNFNKPRLLVVIPKTGIPSEVWALRQAEVLSEKFEVHVLTWERTGTSLDRSYDTFDVHVMNMPWSKRRSLPTRVFRRLCGFFSTPRATTNAEPTRLRRLIASVEPDVVLAHFSWTGRAIAEALGATGPPVVWHVHGRDVGPQLETHRPSRESLARSIANAHHVVCVGAEQRARVVRCTGIPESKTSLIPCGAPRRLFEFIDRSQRTRPSIHFIQIGRISHEKGVMELLRAFAIALKTRSTIHLDLVGDGPILNEAIDEAKSLGVSESVVFHGMKSSEEVAKLCEDSDVLIQNSRDTETWSEGFGVTLCEGGSTGLPLIASRAGGLIDQMEDGVNGILVDQNSPDELASAILRLAESPSARAEMGRKAFELSARFDSELMASKLSGLLMNAVQAEDSSC